MRRFRASQVDVGSSLIPPPRRTPPPPPELKAGRPRLPEPLQTLVIGPRERLIVRLDEGVRPDELVALQDAMRDHGWDMSRVLLLGGAVQLAVMADAEGASE